MLGNSQHSLRHVLPLEPFATRFPPVSISDSTAVPSLGFRRRNSDEELGTRRRCCLDSPADSCGSCRARSASPGPRFSSHPQPRNPAPAGQASPRDIGDVVTPPWVPLPQPVSGSPRGPRQRCALPRARAAARHPLHTGRAAGGVPGSAGSPSGGGWG